MDYLLRWGGDPEDLLLVTFGKVTVEELDAIVQEALADPRYRTNLRILTDHRGAQWDDLTNNDLRRRVDLIARDAHRIGAPRVAWVVSRSVDFGLGRMMQAFLDGRWDADFRVFSEIDEARAWLRGSN